MNKETLKVIIFQIITCVAITGLAYADEVCFQCHDSKNFMGKVVHQPVNQQKCGICHNPHVARHKGLLNAREDQLCFSCHRNLQSKFTSGIVHEPIANGECSSCHAPHVSQGKGLLRDNLANECLKCHDKLPKEYKQTHKPFAEGKCMACHKPHQADNVLLLVDDSTDNLCKSCHEMSTLEKGHTGYPGTLKDCLSCHNPHGSDREHLVRNNLHKPYEEGCSSCHDSSTGVTMTACLKCHENVQGQMEATHSHLTLHEGNSCLNCHSPHAGDTPSLLKARERLICVNCHEVTIHGYKSSPFKHPDINACSSCHESHGSRHISMLKGDGNDTCIGCHKTQGDFSHPVGPEVLNLLTGQMVTCVTCHNPMGTEYEDHLVKDGNQDLCVLCHRTY